MRKKLYLNSHPTGVRGKKQVSRTYSKFYHKSPGLTSLHKLVLGQNLSDIPGGSDWQLTAFLVARAEYDIARMSDDELEILAAGLPIGGCDE